MSEKLATYRDQIARYGSAVRAKNEALAEQTAATRAAIVLEMFGRHIDLVDTKKAEAIALREAEIARAGLLRARANGENNDRRSTGTGLALIVTQQTWAGFIKLLQDHPQHGDGIILVPGREDEANIVLLPEGRFDDQERKLNFTFGRGYDKVFYLDPRQIYTISAASGDSWTQPPHFREPAAVALQQTVAQP